MNITANGHEMIAEAREIVSAAKFGITHPLMIDGEGRFRAQNGQYLDAVCVLQQHFKMQKALVDAMGKLDRVLREITGVVLPS